ncbi:MAG: hydantoinase B/oxoprolinase family protein [Pseudomonadota bacterium]
MSDPIDQVALQVIWNRLLAIVEEQAQSLVRTAFSTSVREAGDLSVGVYDEAGRMLAQAVTGTPGHVNSMAAAVRHFIDHFGAEDMHEGDVFITNDPWLGTGHLHDITVVTPIFKDGGLVAFSACTAHVVDIGGRGFGADASSVYEEGIRLPLMRLAARGAFDQTLLSMLRANVREPDQVVGDVYALCTCNNIGLVRLADLLDEFRSVDMPMISRFILEKSDRATREKIAEIANGTARGEMTIDGYSQPVNLCATVTVKDDVVCCDFAGSAGEDANGINVPLVYTQAYACFALKCAFAPEIPNNYASLAPFIVTAPKGSILNAQHPAPVALRHTVGQMLPDVVFGALDHLLPGRVPAEGAGTLCNFQMSTRRDDATASRSEVLVFNSGGCGARPYADGLSATAFPSGVMSVPVEATEHAGPVVIWRKELRTDSGGTGTFRGGLGQWMEVGALPGYQYEFSAMFDRLQHAATGRGGGGSGGKTILKTASGQDLGGKSRHSINPGDRVVMGFAGGAGYGDPCSRDEAAVKQDLLRDYISLQTAREVYGLSDAAIDEIEQRRLWCHQWQATKDGSLCGE